MIQDAGTQFLTADGAVGAAGTAVRVFAIHFVSDGTAGVLSVRNGSTASGTIWMVLTGTISTGVTVTFGNQGMFFPSGCFMDVDTHVTTVLVSYTYNS